MNRVVNATMLTISIFLLCLSCGDEPINLNQDPKLLAYQFVETEQVNGYAGSLVIDSLENIGEYRVRNLWVPKDTLSTVILDEKLGSEQGILQQITIKTEKVESFEAFDIDNDSIGELVITYVYGDTLFIKILDPHFKEIYSNPICVGEDRNNNGYWEGTGFICGIYDLNYDKIPEILIGCITGYDLYPRKLMCLDWHNDSILWEYNVAGHVTNAYNCLFYRDTTGIRLIFGIDDPNNGVVLDDFSDSESYIICLNGQGEYQWHINPGKKHYGCNYGLISSNLDSKAYLVSVDKRGKIYSDTSHHLNLYDVGGKQLRSASLSNQVRKLAIEDIDENNNDEIILSMNNSEIIVYSSELELLNRYQFNSLLQFQAYADVLNIGYRQIIANGVNQSIWILNNEFKPLAFLKDGGKIGVVSRTDRKQLTVYNNGKTVFYDFEKTPWYMIFSKYPILAFAAGAIPLGLILFIIWNILMRFRKKNRIISNQKDNLDKTLVELKNTQKKLIEAEKYKQAKDIAGGMAHEIHNSLSPAMNSLFMLKKRISQEDKNLRLIDLSTDTIRRAIDLTNSIKFYSKLDIEKDRNEILIAEIFNEVLEAQKARIQEFDIRIITEIETNSSIAATRTQLFSLINNLFQNAIDAVIDTSNALLKFRVFKQGDSIVIEIEDNGCGMSGEDKTKAFEMFYSTKPFSGTGLGLAIVRKILTLYNARIELVSEIDKGSKFTIFWPID